MSPRRRAAKRTDSLLRCLPAQIIHTSAAHAEPATSCLVYRSALHCVASRENGTGEGSRMAAPRMDRRCAQEPAGMAQQAGVYRRTRQGGPQCFVCYHGMLFAQWCCHAFSSCLPRFALQQLFRMNRRRIGRDESAACFCVKLRVSVACERAIGRRQACGVPGNSLYTRAHAHVQPILTRNESDVV